MQQSVTVTEDAHAYIIYMYKYMTYLFILRSQQGIKCVLSLSWAVLALWLSLL